MDKLREALREEAGKERVEKYDDTALKKRIEEIEGRLGETEVRLREQGGMIKGMEGRMFETRQVTGGMDVEKIEEMIEGMKEDMKERYVHKEDFNLFKQSVED